MRYIRASLIAVTACSAFGAQAAMAQTVLTKDNFDGSEYIVYGAPQISWSAAKTFVENNVTCAISGVTPSLATLTRAQEDQFVDDLRKTVSSGEFWIGGSQPAAETTPTANWSWENDEGPIPGSNGSAALGYRNWLAAEPNDAGGPGSEQHLAIGLGNAFGWNDEGNLGNIAGFIAECDAFDNNGIQLLTKNNPNFNIESVGQASSGEAGTATLTTCVVCRTFEGGPGIGKKPATGGGKLDLRKVIKDTAELNPGDAGCVALDQKLDEYAALNMLGKKNEIVMPPWMQPFTQMNGEQCFTASLVQIRDANNPNLSVNIVDGVVLSEEDSLVAGQPEECDTPFVSDSPVTAGRAIPGIQTLRPESVLCNRSRSATRYSDRFQVYDVRLDSAMKTPSDQLVELGKYFNEALDSFAAQSCVNPAFLNEVRTRYAAAEANALGGFAETAITQLQALGVFALNIGGPVDPYRVGGNPMGALCDGEPKAEIGSTVVSLSYHVWRGILYPSSYVNYADGAVPASLANVGNNPATQLRCLLPPFPEPPLDTIPAACADPNFLPAPFGSTP